MPELEGYSAKHAPGKMKQEVSQKLFASDVFAVGQNRPKLMGWSKVMP